MRWKVTLSLQQKSRNLLSKSIRAFYEIDQGNWGDEGFGPVASESCLKLAFFPESVANVSTIINKIERKKRGHSYGSRRLSLIKKAARRKHVFEVTRMAFEDNLVVERGIDPFGLNLNCIAALMIATDPMLLADPHCLAFEDVESSSIADDSQKSRLRMQ
ncbi:hypothetical protein GQ457_12G018640 [Hibiscus cannabinus]